MLVTGSSGIAAATARAVVAAGSNAFVVGVDDEEVRRLVASLNECGTARGCQADLTDESATERAFEECRQTLGSPEGAVAVVGGSGRRFGDGPVDEIPLEGWTRTLDLNVTPMFLTLREATRTMKGSGGSIVVVSSVLAYRPSPFFVTHAYAAAKAASLGLVRSAAAHYGPAGIRINAIAPGLVDTPMSARASVDDDSVAYARAKQPLSHGFLPAASIADAALFLLGSGAAHISGQVLAVDGGWDITEPG